MSRILMVDGALPCREASAGERATFDLIDGLTALGHEVQFTSLGTVGDMSARRQAMVDSGIDVLPGAGGGQAHLTRVLKDPYDVIIVHRPGPALAASEVLSRTTAATIHFGHDIHQWRLAAQQQMTNDVPSHTFLVTRVAERRCWAGYDVSVYPTYREADHINALPGMDGTAVAFPYYRLTSADLRNGDGGDRQGLLMVGGSMHAPNRDAVEFAADRILPLVGETLTVVGDWPQEHRAVVSTNNVEFTGRVSEERLRELHVTHKALLAPLRFGAGSRRKLVAAMGLGLPVITTAEGVRGLLVRDATAADGIAIAAEPEQFARAVSDTDPGMARIARQAVRSVYAQQAHDDALNALLATAARRRDERLSK